MSAKVVLLVRMVFYQVHLICFTIKINNSGFNSNAEGILDSWSQFQLPAFPNCWVVLITTKFFGFLFITYNYNLQLTLFLLLWFLPCISTEKKASAITLWLCVCGGGMLNAFPKKKIGLNCWLVWKEFDIYINVLGLLSLNKFYEIEICIEAWISLREKLLCKFIYS